MSDEFDYEEHERLRKRVAKEADSVLWTYKAYYERADYYTDWDRRFDWAVFVIAGLLTIALIWNSIPQFVPIALAILTAVISGYRRMAEPGDRAENSYRAAHAYQRLFDEFRDFIELDLANKDFGINDMRDTYDGLADRRRTLNEDMPEVTRKWYDRLDEDDVYSEVETSPEAGERLTGEANLFEAYNYHERNEDNMIDDMAGSAEIEEQGNES